MKSDKNLGLDVTTDVRKLDNDTWAQGVLRDIGKTFNPQGLEYKGSVAVHIYTPGPLSLQKTNAAFIVQQHDLPSLVSEKMTGEALRVLIANVMAKYGHANKHNDKSVTGQENLG